MTAQDVSFFGAAGGLAIFFIVFMIFVFVLVIGLTIWWVIVLVEAVQIPDRQWEAAGQSKLLYVLLMIFVGIIGTILYVAVAKPELKRVGPPPPVPAY